MKTNLIYYKILLLIICSASAIPCLAQDTIITIPLGGNAWCNNINHEGGLVTHDGISQWSDIEHSFMTYFKVSGKGNVHISMEALVPGGGHSKLTITMGDQSKPLNLSGSALHTYDLGKWNVENTGYEKLLIEGDYKSGDYFAQIVNIQIKCRKSFLPIACAPFGKGISWQTYRRGPTVYLNYDVPKKDIAYFYNEVTIPKGADAPGSWYNVIGFSPGYFGLQEPSDTERRILYSIWNPVKGQDLDKIPDSSKVVLLKKGENVYTTAFSQQDGTGGQSYLLYPWKAGTTYKFLLRAEPSGNNSATFTAWFFATEENQWKLVASWKRPMTHGLLRDFHSFTENLNPDNGNREHYALYNDTWVCDVSGKWTPVVKAHFTTGNVGKKGYRQDYAGGVKNNSFYLRNGGFFGDKTLPDTWLERDANAIKNPPDIDFSKLP